MDKTWTDRAWEDYLYWQSQDKKILKRLNHLIKDIDRNPYDGIGHPEQLLQPSQYMMLTGKGKLARRINDKNNSLIL
jgi:toxin YoeB